jgi:hypothetical protein
LRALPAGGGPRAGERDGRPAVKAAGKRPGRFDVPDGKGRVLTCATGTARAGQGRFDGGPEDLL